ncbi:MAG: hypothetical protein ABI672_10465 [Vicinamibacteria bacterium]
MIALLVLASVCFAGSRLACRLDRDASRLTDALALGATLGLALFAAIGFMLGWVAGLTPFTVACAALVSIGVCIFAGDPFVVLKRRNSKAPSVAVWILMAVSVMLIARLADRTVFETSTGGLATADRHNFGDLPFHMGIAAGFAYGNNFPPQHPELAGVSLTYPFFGNVIAGMVLVLGGSFRDAFFWPTLILGLSVVVALVRFGEAVTGSRSLGRAAAAMTFFSGGLGFLKLTSQAALRQWWTSGPDLTIDDAGTRYANFVTTLFIPQRSILFGWPLLFFALALVIESRRVDIAKTAERARLWTCAGIVGSLLPLVHAHSFAVLSFCVVMLAAYTDWKLIFRFAAGVLPLALPAVLFMAARNSLSTGKFFEWQPGFDGGRQHIFSFWLMNAGLFLPLVILGLFRARERLVSVLVAAPFISVFVVANLFKLSPWIWDNMKFLAPAHAGVAPFAAIALAFLWRHGNAGRAAAVVVFVATIASGFLDVSKVALAGGEFQIFSSDDLAFAAQVRGVTSADTVILTAPTHNHPILLSGRRLFYGYEGHLWSQGLTYLDRKAAAESMLRGERPITDEVQGLRIGAVAVTAAEGPQVLDPRAIEGLPSLVDSPYRLLKVR